MSTGSSRSCPMLHHCSPLPHSTPLLLLVVVLLSGFSRSTSAANLESVVSDSQGPEYLMMNPFLAAQPDLSAVQPALFTSRKRDLSDPRRIMCGYTLIANLKMQCGERGTFSPNDGPRRIRRGLRLGRRKPSYRPRRLDDICEVYLRYEPYNVVTECCCRGCTKRFLDQFCAKG